MVKQEQLYTALAAGAAITAVSSDSAYADGADFAGFYGGFGIGLMSGNFVYDSDYQYALGETGVGSIFAGYNWALNSNQNMVLGLELAGWSDQDEVNYYGYYGISGLVDFRGRIGWAVGNSSMIYGALGYWQATSTFGDDDTDLSGVSFGIGFETNLNENMFIGADVTTRKVSSESGYYEDDDKGPDPLTTMRIHVGFRF